MYTYTYKQTWHNTRHTASPTVTDWLAHQDTHTHTTHTHTHTHTHTADMAQYTTHCITDWLAHQDTARKMMFLSSLYAQAQPQLPTSLNLQAQTQLPTSCAQLNMLHPGMTHIHQPPGMEYVYQASSAPLTYIAPAAMGMGMPTEIGGDTLLNFTSAGQMDLTTYGHVEMGPAEVMGDVGFTQVPEFPVWHPDTWFP
jgi:hypothetical protein